MSIASDIKSVFDGDGTLSGLITGGIYTSEINREISRTKTPAAYDGNKELLPTILIATEQEIPAGKVYHGATIFVAIFYYERRGTTAIAAAKERAYVLLHRKLLPGYLDVRLLNELPHLEDPGLDSEMIQQRYEVTRVRPNT